MNPFTPAIIIFGTIAVIGVLLVLLDEDLRPWRKR
jgi:hypothetical protein